MANEKIDSEFDISKCGVSISNCEVVISFTNKEISFSLCSSQGIEYGKRTTVINATDDEIKSAKKILLNLLEKSFDKEDFINAKFEFEEKEKEIKG